MEELEKYYEGLRKVINEKKKNEPTILKSDSQIKELVNKNDKLSNEINKMDDKASIEYKMATKEYKNNEKEMTKMVEEKEKLETDVKSQLASIYMSIQQDIAIKEDELKDMQDVYLKNAQDKLEREEKHLEELKKVNDYAEIAHVEEVIEQQKQGIETIEKRSLELYGKIKEMREFVSNISYDTLEQLEENIPELSETEPKKDIEEKQKENFDFEEEFKELLEDPGKEKDNSWKFEPTPELEDLKERMDKCQTKEEYEKLRDEASELIGPDNPPVEKYLGLDEKDAKFFAPEEKQPKSEAAKKIEEEQDELINLFKKTEPGERKITVPPIEPPKRREPEEKEETKPEQPERKKENPQQPKTVVPPVKSPKGKETEEKSEPQKTEGPKSKLEIIFDSKTKSYILKDIANNYESTPISSSEIEKQNGWEQYQTEVDKVDYRMDRKIARLLQSYDKIHNTNFEQVYIEAFNYELGKKERSSLLKDNNLMIHYDLKDIRSKEVKEAKLYTGKERRTIIRNAWQQRRMGIASMDRPRNIFDKITERLGNLFNKNRTLKEGSELTEDQRALQKGMRYLEYQKEKEERTGEKRTQLSQSFKDLLKVRTENEKAEGKKEPEVGKEERQTGVDLEQINKMINEVKQEKKAEKLKQSKKKRESSIPEYTDEVKIIAAKIQTFTDIGSLNEYRTSLDNTKFTPGELEYIYQVTKSKQQAIINGEQSKENTQVQEKEDEQQSKSDNHGTQSDDGEAR